MRVTHFEPSTSQVELRLAAAGFQLPAVHPQGAYAVAVKRGDIVWTAGQLSRTDDRVISGLAITPDDLQGTRLACEVAVLRAIAAVRSIADLDAVEQVLFLRGFIASPPAFTQHTAALDAASNIIALAFGQDIGRPARSAIGVSSLPSAGLVEIELTVALAAKTMA